LIANVIIKSWQFSWKDKKYKIEVLDTFMKSARQDGEMLNKRLDYNIYSEEDEVVMELEITNWDGRESQFLIRPKGNGVIVDIFDWGQTTHKVYDELPAPYGEPYGNKLKSLTHSEKFSYSTFDTISLDVTKVEAKIISENNVLKLLLKKADGTENEASLNRDLEVIHMKSGDIEFERCNVDVALAERQKEIKDFVSLTVPTDCWLHQIDALTGLKVIMHFKGDNQATI
jgi:hypothetical protein